jgi:hypothetical protein
LVSSIASIQGGDHSDRLLSLLLVQAETEGKSGHVLKYFCALEEEAIHRRTFYRNHRSVESLEQR